MVSKFALLSNLLLASAALAVSSSQLGARHVHRREDRQSKSDSYVASFAGPASDVVENPTWAGVALKEGSGTFISAAATFTVPTPIGIDGSASIWVGIDGFSCTSALLQTGIYVFLTDGVPSYQAWYEWWPDGAYNFTDFPINAGDVISVAVTTNSATSGTAYLDNQTTGQNVLQTLTSSYALCEQNADWIVEDFATGGIPVPFIDFGTVTFTEATAIDSRGNAYNPSSSGATLFNINQNGGDVAVTSTSGSTVNIQHVASVNVGPGR